MKITRTLLATTIILASCTNKIKVEMQTATILNVPTENINNEKYTLKEVIYANRLSDGNYELTLKQDSEYNIFCGNFPNVIDWTKATKLKGKETTILINNPNPNKRMLFAAVNNTDTIYISERELDIQNSINVRDLGGIKTKNGKHIKWGKFFRSGALANLTDKDKSYLAEIGLKTIIDLRSSHEMEDQPDTKLNGVEWINIQLGGENTNPNDISKMMKAMMEMKPDDDGTSIMGEFGKKFIERGELFKQEFDLFLNPEKQPIIFHCTAGKDRTGHTSALLLYALGVDMETIYDEYELSNYFRNKKSQENDQQSKAMLEKYGIPENAMIIMNGVNRNWLKMFFNEIQLKYGSVDNFLEQELELDSKAKQKLREMYLY